MYETILAHQDPGLEKLESLDIKDDSQKFRTTQARDMYISSV